MTVDEFVKKRVAPELHPVVEMLRDLILQTAPGATEMISYGIPVYKRRKIFAVISPTKKDITLSFTHGREFEDRYGLLRGVGKVAMHVKIKDVKSANKAALKYYLKQALKLEKG
jgi:hypothetical protein